MITERPIISVHPPKTAGTFLRYVYERMFGPEYVALMYGETGLHLSSHNPVRHDPTFRSWVRASILPHVPGSKIIHRTYDRLYRMTIPQLEDVPPDTQIIHGHFTPERFTQQFPNSPLVVTLRNPADLVISHWRFWMWMYSEGRNPSDPVTGISWTDRPMNLREFAFHPSMQNFQRHYLGGYRLEDFKVVGITEDISTFLQVFGHRFGVVVPQLDPGMRVNATPQEWTSDLTAEEYRKLLEFHAGDMELYREAWETNQEARAELGLDREHWRDLRLHQPTSQRESGTRVP